MGCGVVAKEAGLEREGYRDLHAKEMSRNVPRLAGKGDWSVNPPSVTCVQCLDAYLRGASSLLGEGGPQSRRCSNPLSQSVCS